jgi:hypothetical protein
MSRRRQRSKSMACAGVESARLMRYFLTPILAGQGHRTRSSSTLFLLFMSARQFEQLVPAPVSGLTSDNSGLMESPSSARYAATHGATSSSDLSCQFHCLPSYIDNDDDFVGRNTRLGQDSHARNIDGSIYKVDILDFCHKPPSL